MDLSRSKFFPPGINTASYSKRVGNPILGCNYPHMPDWITSWMRGGLQGCQCLKGQVLMSYVNEEH